MGKGFFNRQNDDAELIGELEQRMQRRMDALCRRIDCLEDELHRLQEELARRPQTIPQETQKKPVETQEETSPQPQQTQTLYLSAPNADGSFASCTPREEAGTSIFVLRTDDGREGSFAFLNTADAMATALISVTQFLKPVCRIQGKTGSMPRCIVTQEEGRAARDGEVWTMTQKAVVKFEE